MLLITFTNDTTGSEKVGNYDVAVYLNNTVIWRGRVEGHERGEGWQGLVEQLSREILLP